MKKKSRECLNNPNSFCYVCGCYIMKKQQGNITELACKSYRAYFGVTLGDQDKPWAHMLSYLVCKNFIMESKED